MSIFNRPDPYDRDTYEVGYRGENYEGGNLFGYYLGVQRRHSEAAERLGASIGAALWGNKQKRLEEERRRRANEEHRKSMREHQIFMECHEKEMKKHRREMEEFYRKFPEARPRRKFLGLF